MCKNRYFYDGGAKVSMTMTINIQASDDTNQDIDPHMQVSSTAYMI